MSKTLSRPMPRLAADRQRAHEGSGVAIQRWVGQELEPIVECNGDEQSSEQDTADECKVLHFDVSTGRPLLQVAGGS